MRTGSGPSSIEPGHTLGGQGADAVREADRLARMVDPVLGVEPLRDGARQVGDDRDLRLAMLDPTRDFCELVEHRLHERRVEGVAGAQPARAAPAGLPFAAQGLQPRALTREHALARCVDAGERDAVAELELVLCGLDGQHRPALGKGAHQLPAGSHQSHGVLERQDPCDVRGGQLPDGMTDQVARLEPERLDQAVQSDLEGKQRRLGHLGVVERLRLGPDLAAELGADLVQRSSEDRERLVEAAAHLRPLRTLTAEQEGRPSGQRSACDGVRRQLAAREPGQAGEQLLA